MMALRCRGLIHSVLMVSSLVLAVAGCSDDDAVAPDVPIDTSVSLPLPRAVTYPASAPAFAAPDPVRNMRYQPDNRVPTIRWFHPWAPTYQYELYPELLGDARLEPINVTDLYLRDDGDAWDPDDWGGVMRSLHWDEDRDLSGTAFLSVWINDFTPDASDRSGRLHIDVGTISEDFFWPDTNDGPEYGTRQTEDVDGDGQFIPDEEDFGLDAVYDYGYLVNSGDPFSVERGTEEDPFPDINNTAFNSRWDDEDLDHNGVLDNANDYLAFVIDLADTTAFIDVLRDYPYPPDFDGDAWRLYRLPIHTAAAVGEGPVLHDIRHLRIWYEDEVSVYGRDTVHLQIAPLVFE